MSNFNFQFSRYNSYGGRTVSADQMFTRDFDSFDDAVRHAKTMVAGMRAADPESEFEIASITVCSYAVKPLGYSESVGNPLGVPKRLKPVNNGTASSLAPINRKGKQ